MPAPAQLPPDAVQGAYFDFVPPPCLLPEPPDDALPPDATDWLLPLAPPLLPADDDFAPLASCTLLLPPFLPA